MNSKKSSNDSGSIDQSSKLASKSGNDKQLSEPLKRLLDLLVEDLAREELEMGNKLSVESSNEEPS